MASKATDRSPPSRTPKPLVIPADRRALIDEQVAKLSATARKVATWLPLQADVTDFTRILNDAGRR